MAAVSLKGVAKRFFSGTGQETQAVRSLDLGVEDRELFVITGPSGCGKTTLLRLIAGLGAPDAGSVQVFGKRVLVGDTSNRVGMIFQQPALYPRMTVHDNIAFGLKIRRVARDEVNKRVQGIAEATGVSGLLTRLPHELSGGECQRVALARALILEPRLLLLDEPLSNVDALGRTQLRNDILRLHRQTGLPMVYVTHDQYEAMAVGSRIAVMKHGRVEQVGEPKDVYDRPRNAFVASFFGLPPMNLLTGSVTDGTMFTLDGGPVAEPVRIRLPQGPPAASGPLRLGIRPECLTINAPPDHGRLAIPATVEAVQFAGAELHLRCKVGEQTVVSCAPTSSAIGAHQQCVLTADWENLRWFAADADGGRME